ncbi:MAG: SH3 domain-containing protein [Alphaproteobacteria bacterium]
MARKIFLWLMLAGWLVVGENGFAIDKNKLPKMVSLKWHEVNVRKGPGKRFPIAFILKERGVPLKLIRRHGDWREIVDWQGSKGWILRSALSDKSTLIIHVDETDMMSKPHRSSSDRGRLIAKLKKGVTAEVITCDKKWCRVETFIGKRQGWIRKMDSRIEF